MVLSLQRRVEWHNASGQRTVTCQLQVEACELTVATETHSGGNVADHCRQLRVSEWKELTGVS